MIRVGCWNIRGLNSPIKQREVKHMLLSNNLSFCALLETHLNSSVVDDTCRKIFGQWSWCSNAGWCSSGTRIVCAWNTRIIDVMVLESHAQYINCQVHIKGDLTHFFLSVVYGANTCVMRRQLWSGMRKFKVLLNYNAWLACGDFNSMLFPHDGWGGSSRRNMDMLDFANCVEDVDLFDMKYSGTQFTWVQKPSGGSGIMRKLDRVLTNSEFVSRFQDAGSIFLPRGISDHSPCIVSFKGGVHVKAKGFKFDNFMTMHPDFLKSVSDYWRVNFDRSFMYRVVQRLRTLKKPFRRLRSEYGHLHKRVEFLRFELEAAQVACDDNPFNLKLREDLAHLSLAFHQACLDDEAALRQRAKIAWLNEGDSNTRFFHQVVKEKRHFNRCTSVADLHGNFVHDDDVPKVFLEFFTDLLGKEVSSVDPSMDPLLFSRRISLHESLSMLTPISDEEIRLAMFSIGNDKAPGSDGFIAKFFKAAWSEVGSDVLLAVHEFFYRSCLLRQLNHTLLCLIPKKPNAASVTDYRPISCCNVLYKCISKIVADRMKGALNGLINQAQYAFITSRRISDNILMAHELVAGYHRGVGPPKCAFKIDIRKAYDTVNWKYVTNMLLGLGFHPAMVRWIDVMLSSVSYTLALNGDKEGFFMAKRGLRQGDPLSPYLFTIAMEGFSLILQRCIEEASEFGYHQGCAELGISHLCFADDLFVFTRGDLESIEVLKKALSIFKTKSWLEPSLEKSEVFFGNVSSGMKEAILLCLPFRDGVFPIRYLGVPLSPVRLKNVDFQVLVQNVHKRIHNWKAKFLSYGGRRQLVNSVLQSLQLYWMAVFLIPSDVIHEIETLYRDFLWAQGEKSKGKCRVAWENVCKPLKAGGLGFKNLSTWNRSFLVKHIWDILCKRQSLWVRWITMHCVHNESIWEVSKKASWSWTFRCILDLRDQSRPFFISKIGDGTSINAWSDRWMNCGSLSALISYRLFSRVGLRRQSSVADLVSLLNDEWPQEWRDRSHHLLGQNVPVLTNGADSTLWIGVNGQEQQFSVSIAYRSLVGNYEPLSWCKVVWSKGFVAKHAMCAWMACLCRLPTQDRLISWKHNPPDYRCLFCGLCIDSHNHLFFQCGFSGEIWKNVKEAVGIIDFPDSWEDILIRFHNGIHWNSMQKLAFSAVIYMVWKERNARLFKKGLRTVGMVTKMVNQLVVDRMAWKNRNRDVLSHG